MNKRLQLLFSMTIYILLFTFTYLSIAEARQAIIDVNSINVRSGPGTEFPVIHNLSKNSKHTILEERDRWFRISFDNKEGWIASWLVSIEEEDNNTSVKVSVAETTINTLNVRSGPSTSFSVIATIKPKEFYPILENRGEWLQIQLNPQTVGWVATQFVNITTQESSQIPSIADSRMVTVTATVLNVRAEPTTSARILDKLSKGQVVKLLNIRDGWYQIEYNNIIGWIASEFAVQNDSNSGQQQQPAVPTQPSTPTVPAQPSTPEPEKKELAVVNVSVLNVRSGPGTEFAITGRLNQNDLAEIIEKNGDWLKISFNGSEGWIANWLVTIRTSEQPLSQTPHVIIPKSGLNIRSGPGTTFNIVATTKEGETYPIVNTHGEWYEISLPNGTGFIASWIVHVSGIDSVDNTNRSVAGLLKGKTIVIDPGHGGIDAGAIGSHFKTLEKDITLSTSLLLESKLKAAGANVIMTRKTDQFVSLAQRVTISSNNKADAFISMHYNTNHNPSINGTIVYHYTKSGKDAKFAQIVQQEIVQRNGLRDLGARQGNYFVLRENPQLSILVEAAFLSNYNDELVSRTKPFQEKVAEGVFQGVLRYFNP